MKTSELNEKLRNDLRKLVIDGKPDYYEQNVHLSRALFVTLIESQDGITIDELAERMYLFFLPHRNDMEPNEYIFADIDPIENHADATARIKESLEYVRSTYFKHYDPAELNLEQILILTEHTFW